MRLKKIKNFMKMTIEKRPLDGLLLLDKSLGQSSNAVLQQAKRLFQAQKAGHTGSLDPLASGLLPICFGQASKFSQFLLDADKTYIATAQLGAKTSTADAEGEIIATGAVPLLSEPFLDSVFAQFRGALSQVPSMYSALKYQGRPLYTLARQGIEITRPARDIMIYELRLLSFTPTTFTVLVRCSKGTYIRNLIEDIGDYLQCGAYVSALRRTQVGHLPQEMYALDVLESYKKSSLNDLDACLLPVSTLVTGLPQLSISEDVARLLLQGKCVKSSDVTGDKILAVYCRDIFIGVVEITEDSFLKAKRMMSPDVLLHLI
jgi:tRNA pseudouridine55 synthase